MIFEDQNVVAFTPYASRFPYEVWVFPLRHIQNFAELAQEEMHSMAAALKQILGKLRELNAPYNYYFHYGNFHFHLEVVPRFSKVKWAGFEMSTGTIINPVTPEAAAEFYRSESPKEEK